MSFLFSNRSSKTFKPKKNIPEGSHQHELMKHANATLGSGRRKEVKEEEMITMTDPDVKSSQEI